MPQSSRTTLHRPRTCASSAPSRKPLMLVVSIVQRGRLRSSTDGPRHSSAPWVAGSIFSSKRSCRCSARTSSSAPPSSSIPPSMCMPPLNMSISSISRSGASAATRHLSPRSIQPRWRASLHAPPPPPPHASRALSRPGGARGKALEGALVPSGSPGGLLGRRRHRGRRREVGHSTGGCTVARRDGAQPGRVQDVQVLCALGAMQLERDERRQHCVVGAAEAAELVRVEGLEQRAAAE
eukprot:scaffold93499_cov58-Phaeocystis_antarctica.AAC.3